MKTFVKEYGLAVLYAICGIVILSLTLNLNIFDYQPGAETVPSVVWLNEDPRDPTDPTAPHKMVEIYVNTMLYVEDNGEVYRIRNLGFRNLNTETDRIQRFEIWTNGERKYSSEYIIAGSPEVAEVELDEAFFNEIKNAANEDGQVKIFYYTDTYNYIGETDVNVHLVYVEN